MYGEFQESFSDDSILTARVDCGSHCEEYGNPPGETPFGLYKDGFCNLTEIMQPTGGEKKKKTCPPEKGWALLESVAWAARGWVIGAPVS